MFWNRKQKENSPTDMAENQIDAHTRSVALIDYMQSLRAITDIGERCIDNNMSEEWMRLQRAGLQIATEFSRLQSESRYEDPSFMDDINRCVSELLSSAHVVDKLGDERGFDCNNSLSFVLTGMLYVLKAEGIYR
jgi:hypothetical protein